MPKSFDIFSSPPKSKIDNVYRGPVVIYAELTKKQQRQIANGEVDVVVPYGTTLKNKRGSRGLHFVCESVEVAQELKDGLDASDVSWQEEFYSEDI